MQQIVEARYPVAMQFNLEIKMHELNPNFGKPGETSRYTRVNPTSRTFNTTRLMVNKDIVLLHFSGCCYVHYDELIRVLNDRNLRPLEFHEHLAFVAQYPNEAGEFTIISLGSALHFDYAESNNKNLQSCLVTGPHAGAYPNLRWNIPIPIKEDFFATSGDPKFYFGCADL